ncbi:hypothetical protein L2E82_14745 [Cichorium intybus]|uniref:Uncharacterized protein n=1 Tax=Cichorium intybus TaxID=13427 RepID=A0ACB9F0U6_CICIN|nr:hypothetical protein L2E82_14745 [Cichorium intybus]
MALPYIVFQPQAFELCPRKVAASSGDMRKALGICRSSNVRVDHMATALSKAYKSPIVDTIQSLPQHQQVFDTKGCKTPKSEKSIISDNVAHHHDSATQEFIH